MKRKITKNKHQYKISLPIELIRKLRWENNNEIEVREVSTRLGKGLLIVSNKENILKLR